MTRRADLIKTKMARLKQPIVVSLDASRFDAHVVDMLAVEHLIYKRYWKSPQLQRLLDWQVKNKGRTSCGIKYSLIGSRMSGDMNTALGNCLISIIMLATIMKYLKISTNEWDMLCDGDDVLLFLEAKHKHLIQSLPDYYLQFGFKMKIENITTNYNKIRFCQTFPIETIMGAKMVSDPTRTMSRSLVGVKHWSENKFVPKYLALIGLCELALNMGVPVLQEFALTILSWGSHLPKNIQMTGRTIKALREERHHYIQPLDITIQARLDFEQATGICIEEQYAMEQALRALNRHASKEEAATTNTPPINWAPRWYPAEQAQSDTPGRSRPLYRATHPTTGG